MDLFNYSRRETSEVNIGAVPLVTTYPYPVDDKYPTQDTEACVAQEKRIVDAGGEYVRLTTGGERGRKPDEHQYQSAQYRLYGSACGRCTLQPESSRCKRHNMPRKCASIPATT